MPLSNRTHCNRTHFYRIHFSRLAWIHVGSCEGERISLSRRTYVRTYARSRVAICPCATPTR